MLSELETVLLFGGLLVLLIVLILGWFFVYKRIIFRVSRRHIISKDEYKAFVKGLENASCTANVVDEQLQLLPYNKKLEIRENKFKIDTNTVLDAGLYGSICAGKILKSSGDIDVIVKMSGQSCKKSTIFGFMREIKLLLYLDTHPNIILLLGAYTKNMQQGSIMMFFENCPGGLLEAHLNSIKAKYTFSQATATSKSLNWADAISPYIPMDFFYWALEIAEGMEYCASKQIIHANLCTRNVMLGMYNQAKICGFEAANRQVNYAYYSEKEHSELAWRWLAPETLRRLRFSEQSDVWSYGITIWEIYTLAEVPFANVATREELLALLYNGTCLQEPYLCQNLTLYTDVMRKCLSVNSKLRPTFSIVVTMLKNVTGKVQKRQRA